ncbi:MAG: MerP protein [Bacteroidetes bacterium]|nr:heavy-metal-associated domain-containing protein [Bacteroidia bacterium]PCH69932.1 MAG: MerP protein [Bacteroidota bacterium]
MMNILELFIVSAFMLSPCSTPKDTAKTNQQEIVITTSAVCGMCKKTIEKALSYEKGVKGYDLDVATKKVTVKYNPNKTTVENIRTAISKVGYDADEVEADPVAYEKLHGCCKKDAGVH